MADDGGKASEGNVGQDKQNVNSDSERKVTEEGLTSSVESNSHPPLPDIAALNANAFNALANYVQDDLLAVAEDYKLLEKMNRVATGKYSEMKEITTSVHIEMEKINDKYRSLGPYLEQIDQIEESVAALEEVAYRLDAYSKRLEAKFKQLEKR